MARNYMKELGEIPEIELKPIPNVLVKIPTQKVYDTLMKLYEAGRWCWKDGHLPTEYRVNVGPGTLIEAIDSFDHFDASEVEKGKKKIDLEEFCKIQNIDNEIRGPIYKWFRDNRPNRASLGQRLL